jgi:hypothetical protein
VRDARTVAARLNKLEAETIQRLADEHRIPVSELIRTWLTEEILKRAGLKPTYN